MAHEPNKLKNKKFADSTKEIPFLLDVPSFFKVNETFWKHASFDVTDWMKRAERDWPYPIACFKLYFFNPQFWRGFNECRPLGMPLLDQRDGVPPLEDSPQRLEQRGAPSRIHGGVSSLEGSFALQNPSHALRRSERNGRCSDNVKPSTCQIGLCEWSTGNAIHIPCSSIRRPRTRFEKAFHH